ncbi:uncharacterized protein [Ptychodera flava]|uniref:uncharacterized protein n=1 Tax=Ptychodera flava TaxID=63121 RepID=UPI00396A4F42
MADSADALVGHGQAIEPTADGSTNENDRQGKSVTFHDVEGETTSAGEDGGTSSPGDEPPSVGNDDTPSDSRSDSTEAQRPHSTIEMTMDLTEEQEDDGHRPSSGEVDVSSSEDKDDSDLERTVINMLENIGNSDKENEPDMSEEEFPAPPSEAEIAAMPSDETAAVTVPTGYSDDHDGGAKPEAGHQKVEKADFGGQVVRGVDISDLPQDARPGLRYEPMHEPGKVKRFVKPTYQSMIDHGKPGPQKREHRELLPLGGVLHSGQRFDSGEYKTAKLKPWAARQKASTRAAWAIGVMSVLVMLAIIFGFMYYSLDKKTVVM